jgi:hypothetical protein
MNTERALACLAARNRAMAETTAASPEAAAKSTIKKGSLVRVNRSAYANSLEAQASDTVAPDYIFEGPAEVLMIKGDYAQLRFRRPVPDAWLRVDQLDAF